MKVIRIITDLSIMYAVEIPVEDIEFNFYAILSTEPRQDTEYNNGVKMVNFKKILVIRKSDDDLPKKDVTKQIEDNVLEEISNTFLDNVYCEDYVGKFPKDKLWVICKVNYSYKIINRILLEYFEKNKTNVEVS